jgi:hypothetical protein
MKLKISDDLVLAADFVTSTQAILAQKGKGKSYAAAVEAEELLDAGQIVVIIDPTDAHFGLRSSPDGRSTGYPIAVFGGDHGDVPLEPGGGAVLAEAVVRERFSAIVCTETMTKGEELRFVGDFLETLYRKNREAMHLFIDEADVFAPQQTFGVADARTCGATDDIVRRGRKKGIGCTLITQRASAINKNVLSQADMLVALGCSHPLDLDAIEKWVRKNADPKLAQEMMSSLPSLPRGEAWVWNPSQHLFKRVAIRQRHTFDSGATPKAGEKKREPKVLAPIDLARLGKSMIEAVERQRESDPKALRAKIAELVRERDQLSRAVNAAPVEKPVLTDKQISRIEKIIKHADRVTSGVTARLEKTIEDVRATFGGALTDVKQAVGDLRPALKAAGLNNLEWSFDRAFTLVPKAKPDAGVGSWHKSMNRDEPAEARSPKLALRNGTNGASIPDGLKPAHLRLLSAIAWWESIGVSTPDLGGVAFVAGTTTRSSAFANNRSRLRSSGYIDYPSAGRVQLTDAGHAIAPPPSIPPTTDALHETILNKVLPAHGRMLRVLIDAYPTELPLEEFAKRSGTSVSSSAFANNRSWLRARGLADYPRTGYVRASELLFPGHRGALS